MTVVIKWASTSTINHEAILDGGRVEVTTTSTLDPDAIRVESGPTHKVLPRLTDPTGKYRLAPLLGEWFQRHVLELEAETQFNTLRKAQIAESVQKEQA